MENIFLIICGTFLGLVGGFLLVWGATSIGKFLKEKFNL